MEIHDSSPPKRIDANEVNTTKRPNITSIHSHLDTIVNSLPLSKDKQEPSFGDVLKKAYEDFPKLKTHADLHPSEYMNATDLINTLPVQLQDKWRLLRFCLWYQYGPSIFGVIFDLNPNKILKETALLSDLPDKLTNMVQKLLQESDDEDEEEDAIAGNITSESSQEIKYAHPPLINSEKKEFVILAQGGQKWNRLTQNQRLVLEQRYLIDRPESLTAIARQLERSYQLVYQIETAGLRKLGFFGDRINLTGEQCQKIFQNAKEEEISSLTPKELELLKRLYGSGTNGLHSQPTLKSVSAELEIKEGTVNVKLKNALQKLLQTKRAIHIVNFSLTPEQLEFLRRTIPLKGRHATAKAIGISPHASILGKLQQEGIKSKMGRPKISVSPGELEFIKANYPDMNIFKLGKLTGHSSTTIAKWLRGAEVSIKKPGRLKKITS